MTRAASGIPKLAEHGMVASRVKTGATALVVFLDGDIAALTDAKPNTWAHLTRSRDIPVTYFKSEINEGNCNLPILELEDAKAPHHPWLCCSVCVARSCSSNNSFRIGLLEFRQRF
jgi:hypothetical protein